MSSPRHLWSGDWQGDSAAVAEELAKRRAQGPGEPAEIEPEVPAPRPGPSAIERLVVALRQLGRGLARLIGLALVALRAGWDRLVKYGKGRRLGVALAVAVVALLSAGVAFAVTSLLVGSGGNGSPTASTNRVWLGVGMTSPPNGGGAMITTVAPGSPAANGGLQSGDVITEINNQPIGGPGDVSAALSGLRAGNQLQVQFSRGPVSYSTLVTLATRPPAAP
jgi:PDZ domain